MMIIAENAGVKMHRKSKAISKTDSLNQIIVKHLENKILASGHQSIHDFYCKNKSIASRATLNRILKNENEIKVEMLFKICCALNIKLKDFFQEIDSELI